MNAVVRNTMIFIAGLGAGALVMAQTTRSDGSTPLVEPQDTASASIAHHGSADGADAAAQTMVPASLAQLAALLAAERDARERLAQQVERLGAEVEALRRQQVAALATGRGEDHGTDPATAVAAVREASADPTQTMVALGVPPQVAADLKRRVDKVELDRLTLRDRAAREGWLGNDKYFEALRKVDGDVQALRGELGDEVYDKFLYAMGESNRVRVDGVLDGSAAATADIRANDTIVAYAGQRIFTWDELRQATSAGQAGEPVPVTVVRDGQAIEVVVPRGPLGVKLDATRERPQ